MAITIQSLIRAIENAQGVQPGPKCGHCLRTLKLTVKDGRRVLYCQHCEELAESDSEPLYYPADN